MNAVVEDERPAIKRSRVGSVSAGLMLATVTTLLLLLIIEGLLHLLNYPPTQTEHQKLFVEYDSVRGWRNIPNAQGHYITQEYRVPMKFNSRGIRGPDYVYAKPRGKYRVVILGDSYVEGYMVQQHERVSEVLQRLLNTRRGADVAEVIALGTAGYSTDQELLWLESEGVRYQPDLVIAMLYANDVWYNTQLAYWRGGKPLFVFQNDTLVLTNVPVPRAALDARKEQRTVRDFIEQNSKLYWIASAAIKNVPSLHALAIRAGLAEVPLEMVLAAGDHVAVPAEFNVYRTQRTPEVELAWRTTQALLARMQRIAESVNGEFLTFLVPLRGDIYTSEETLRTNNSHTSSGWDPQAVTREFNRMCGAERLRCVDATEQFRRAAQRGGSDQRLYYRFDWHWNARGHAFAAELLADYITRHKLLE
jgi:lysophospholipase L1-like esterase